MKQVIEVIFGGKRVMIEDIAYEKVKTYIETFRQYHVSDETVAGIEVRVAELMNDKIQKGAAYITEDDVDEMIKSVGRPEDFNANTESQSSTSNYIFTEKRRLYRDSNNKILGGVCSGVAAWLKMDPTIVRVLFAIITFGGFGSGVLIYLGLWIFLPSRNLSDYTGKRMYRDPDNKWFGGVAGGMGAYFNINPNTIRWIFSIPLLISVIKGVHILGWNNHFNIFPNLFFNGLTGTFIFIYIVLWIILPEARTPYQKMEMQGNPINADAIKENVKNSFGDINERLKGWSQEVKESAEKLGKKAGNFAHTRGQEFGGEFTYAARRSRSGIGQIIAMLFKVFFGIIGGIIAISLLAVFLTLFFSGFSWAPINNFLWTSNTQQLLGFGTLLLFIGAPIAGLVVWLARRILNVNTPGNYLNWTFGGLWTIGWICLVFFLASFSNDFKRSGSVDDQAVIQQPVNGKLIFKVSAPALVYENNFNWLDNGRNIEGFKLTADTLQISTVRLNFQKSDDNLYHITIIKQAVGRTDDEATARARTISYGIASVADSIIDLPNGFVVNKNNKYRFQNVIVNVKVPEGKKIYVDQSVDDKLSDLDIDFNSTHNRNRGIVVRNTRNYRSNTDYTMQADGSLKSDTDETDVINSKPGTTGNDTNYRWDGDNSNENTATEEARLSRGATTDTVYHYNEAPVKNKSKEELSRELDQKQKEIDELKKKLNE